VSYDVEGPEPVPRRSIAKPVRTAIVLGMLAVAVLAAFQWGWQQLTLPFDDAAAAEPTATPECTPAPDAVAALPPPSRIRVNIYNSSGIPEIASRTADELRAQGFKIGAVDNDPLGKQLDGVGEIRSAPNVNKRVAQLRRYIPGATWIKDDRPGRTLDFAVGANFAGVVVPKPLPEGATENTEDDIPTC
jgi:hypothetical protein